MKWKFFAARVGVFFKGGFREVVAVYKGTKVLMLSCFTSYPMLKFK